MNMNTQAGSSMERNAAVNFHNTTMYAINNVLQQPPQLQQQDQEKRAAAAAVREQDQYMPIANVIRIMRRILPPHAKISDDAKETIQECVSEYISFITGEANERCQREQRKTITAEDVLWAMGKLGFDDYVEPLTLFINRYRESESDRPQLSRDGILTRRSSSTTAADYGGHGLMPPYASSYPTVQVPQQGLYDPTMPAPVAYYRDLSNSAASGSGSSSQNAPPNYDPFAHNFRG